jgi:hypothetical protein
LIARLPYNPFINARGQYSGSMAAGSIAMYSGKSYSFY